MNYFLYSIKDTCAGSFNEILIFQNDELAIRYFKNLCAESKIKNDLQLYKLGTYDNITGVITNNVEFLKGGAEND